MDEEDEVSMKSWRRAVRESETLPEKLSKRQSLCSKQAAGIVQLRWSRCPA